MISANNLRTGALPTLFILAFISTSAWAVPVQNPANGHYYEVISGSAKNWQQASDDAQAHSLFGRQGHLATLTSQEESDWVLANLSIPQTTWLGGMQDPAGAEPADGWGWVTGETWSFTNWGGVEPNDSGGEDCLHFRSDGAWNDIACTQSYTTYLIEFGVGDEDARATFSVYKHFDDGNDGDVHVTITCTTGVPMNSEATFSEDENPIEFIVQDYDVAELDCEIEEDPLDGYSTEYEASGGLDSSQDIAACRYENVAFGEAHVCDISNNIDPVTVHIGKEWIDEQAGENGEVLFAGAHWSCDPVANRASGRIQLDPHKGLLWFSDPSSLGGGRFYDQDSFWFYPHYEGTGCSITELELDTDILSDDSDCDDLEFFPGYEADLDSDDDPIPACVIINTRIYAGIPTLSEYGLALLALLMLGVGFVGYRRFA